MQRLSYCKKQFWLFSIALVSILTCVLSQRLSAQSETSNLTPAGTVFGSAQTATIPFEYNPLTSGGIVVHVSINGHSAMPFIVDTGINLPILLSQRAAKELGVTSDGKSDKFFGTDTTIYEGGPLRAALLGASPNGFVTLNFSHAYFANIDALIAGTSDGEIAGFLGGSLFDTLAAQIDFDAHHILLSPVPHSPLNIPGAIRLDVTDQEGVYCVSLPLVGSNPSKLRLDTGSNISAVDSTVISCASPSLMAVGPHETFAGQGFSEMYLVHRLHIGLVQLDSGIVMRIPDTDDGLLGRDILTQFKITLDFPNKQMLLEARNTPNLPDGDSGAILEQREQGYYVDYIYPGSPAVTAGLKPGDMILKVNEQSLKPLRSILAQKLLDGYAHVKENVVVGERNSKTTSISLLPGSEDDPAYFDSVRMRLSPIEGTRRTLVSGILCSSAAWQAGIRAGDDLLTVNGVTVTSKSVSQIEAILQRPVPKLTITVRHPGAKTPQTVTLTMAGIPTSMAQPVLTAKP